jgi:hypothetical protein
MLKNKTNPNYEVNPFVAAPLNLTPRRSGFHMIIIVYFQRYHMELAHNHPPPAKSGQVV